MYTFFIGGIMNQKYLDLAFEYAQKAFDIDEVPIGAVIVKNDEIIGCGYNIKESSNSVLKHAELIAIEEASNNINNWRLDECDIYVTLDPCPMCASAIKQSRIKNVYSALNNADENNLKIITEIFKTDRINPKINFISNLNVDKSKNLLNSFFKKQRNN